MGNKADTLFTENARQRIIIIIMKTEKNLIS